MCEDAEKYYTNVFVLEALGSVRLGESHVNLKAVSLPSIRKRITSD